MTTLSARRHSPGCYIVLGALALGVPCHYVIATLMVLAYTLVAARSHRLSSTRPATACPMACCFTQ